MTVLPLALALLLDPLAAPPAGVAAPEVLPYAAAPFRADAASRAVAPLQPLEVAERFDPPSAAYGAGHRGVDLRGAAGAPVRSALAGTVTTAGSIAGMPVVVVSHGETRTTYQPVVAAVAVGEPVEAGDVLGALSPSPSHCAPAACLHWGLKAGEDYLDPLSLLGPRRVRLLPLLGGPAGGLTPSDAPG